MIEEDDQTILHLDEAPKVSDINLSMRLSKYDDLFNYFDQRDLIYKTISEDFIIELQRYFTHLIKNEDFTNPHFYFFIPEKERNLQKELIILNRLREHFEYNLDKTKKKRKWQIIKTCIILTLSFSLIAGGLYMQTIDVAKGSMTSWLVNISSTFLNMAGWIGTWYKVDSILNRILSGPEKKLIKFLTQINSFRLGFLSYESRKDLI